MYIPWYTYALLILGIVALLWGSYSIIIYFLRRSNKSVESIPKPIGEYKTKQSIERSVSAPDQISSDQTRMQIKEWVAIIGGITSIIVGIITILEKT